MVADILIVDDRKENLDVLMELLTGEGHHVRPVTSGAMALVAAHEMKPDLILLDISMPELSGFDVCQRLKRDARLADVPVLFITALQETENKLLAFQVGAADYITKPFNFEEVKARVRTHLRLHGLREELRQRNAGLEEAHERLVGLEKMRDNLTHMIVHDLRAPLAGVVGCLRFMKEDAEADDGRVRLSDVNSALESSNRLIGMISDLLDIGRLEAAEMPMKVSEVNLGDLSSSVVSLLGPEKASRIETSIPMGMKVNADRGLFERVVLNLVDNALKFSPPNTTIQVTVDATADAWMLAVEDQGPGIPNEFKKKVFEKFGQVQAREANLGSTGLGLTFCRLAVQAHGGTIEAKDGEAGGNRIELVIPLAPTKRGAS